MSDTILDVNHRRIRVGRPVAGDGAEGYVSGIVSMENNDGEPPIVCVQWPEWDEPERYLTGPRDYRQEGPSGPYVYLCEDIELAEVPIPDRLKDRPRSSDMVVPFLADSTDQEHGEGGGVVIFGKSDPVRWAECVEDRKCAMCGDRLEYWIAFIGGPRSVQFRSFLDPAMHVECAEYAMAVCPWMLGGEDFGLAERTLPTAPMKELTKIEDGDENRIAMYLTHGYKVRKKTIKVNRAPQVIVYCFANPLKRVEWRDRPSD